MDLIHTARPLFVALLLLAAGENVFSAEIIKIAASRKMMAIGGLNSADWHVNDSVCLERNAANRVCGQVIKVLPKGVIFSASNANHDFQAGETVNFRHNGRSVASQEYETTTTRGSSSRRESSGNRNDLTVGIQLIQPTIQYQRAIGSHFAIGLMPIYMNFSSADGTLNGIGGHLTLHYYSKSPFRGWWGMAGLGFYSFTASLNASPTASAASEKGSTLSALGTFGYRFLFGGGWNLALAGGVQYLANPQTASLQFSSILPAASLDVGYAF